MFDFKNKLAQYKNLNEVLANAHKLFSDYVLANSLTPEVSKAFTAELSEVVELKLAESDFKYTDINLFTESDKTSAVSSALEAEKAQFTARETELTAQLEAAKAEAQEKQTSLQAEIDTLKNEKTTLEASIADLNAKLTSAETESKAQIAEARIKTFLSNLETAGLVLNDSMKTRFSQMAQACVEDETKLAELENDILSTVKQSVLLNGSRSSAGASPSGGNDTDDLGKKLAKVREDYKANQK